MRAKSRRRRRGFRRLILRLVAVVIITSITVIGALRWIPPPTSAFMLRSQYFSSHRGAEMDYRWTAWETISPHMALAVIASEDQKFLRHWGFDIQQIKSALQESKQRTQVRGASTITQQVAKNLFLWPGRSYLRKGVEAYLTVMLELLWSKRRILEVYLNIAEFAPGVFGVEAASRRFFSKPPAGLNAYEAALLAAVLPNPRRLKISGPSPYVRGRTRWILRQMEQLESMGYVSALELTARVNAGAGNVCYPGRSRRFTTLPVACSARRSSVVRKRLPRVRESSRYGRI